MTATQPRSVGKNCQHFVKIFKRQLSCPKFRRHCRHGSPHTNENLSAGHFVYSLFIGCCVDAAASDNWVPAVAPCTAAARLSCDGCWCWCYQRGRLSPSGRASIAAGSLGIDEGQEDPATASAREESHQTAHPRNTPGGQEAQETAQDEEEEYRPRQVHHCQARRSRRRRHPREIHPHCTPPLCFLLPSLSFDFLVYFISFIPSSSSAHPV